MKGSIDDITLLTFTTMKENDDSILDLLLSDNVPVSTWESKLKATKERTIHVSSSKAPPSPSIYLAQPTINSDINNSYPPNTSLFSADTPRISDTLHIYGSGNVCAIQESTRSSKQEIDGAARMSFNNNNLDTQPLLPDFNNNTDDCRIPFKFSALHQNDSLDDVMNLVDNELKDHPLRLRGVPSVRNLYDLAPSKESKYSKYKHFQSLPRNSSLARELTDFDKTVMQVKKENEEKDTLLKTMAMGYENNDINGNIYNNSHIENLLRSDHIASVHHQNYMSQNESMNAVGSFRAMLDDESDDSSDEQGGISFSAPPSTSSFSIINDKSSSLMDQSKSTSYRGSGANDTCINFSKAICDHADTMLSNQSKNTTQAISESSTVTVFNSISTPTATAFKAEHNTSENNSDQLFVKPEPHSNYPVLNFAPSNTGLLRQSNKDDLFPKMTNSFPLPHNVEDMKLFDPFTSNLPVDGKCTSCGKLYKISYDSDWLELKLCDKCTNQLRDSLPEQLKHPKRRKTVIEEFSDNPSPMDTKEGPFTAQFTTENLPSSIASVGAIKSGTSTHDSGQSSSLSKTAEDLTASSSGETNPSTLAHLVTVSPGNNSSVQSAPLYLFIQGKVIPVTIGQIASSSSLVAEPETASVPPTTTNPNNKNVKIAPLPIITAQPGSCIMIAGIAPTNTATTTQTPSPSAGNKKISKRADNDALRIHVCKYPNCDKKYTKSSHLKAHVR